MVIISLFLKGLFISLIMSLILYFSIKLLVLLPFILTAWRFVLGFFTFILLLELFSQYWKILLIIFVVLVVIFTVFFTINRIYGRT